FFGPRLVAVLRQQLTVVDRERLARRDDVFFLERAPSEIFELYDIDARVGVGAKKDIVTAQYHRVGNIDGPAGVVRRLVQLWCRLVDRVVGPHEIDDLLTVQT